MRRIFTTTCLFALSGCATLSFAPPIVNEHDELEFKGTQTFFDAVCTPTKTGRTIDGETVEAARRLINNYRVTYKCQRSRAAEGKQFFDVPSFLATAGAATAVALGAGPTVMIAAGAGAATLDHTKQYYSPQDKAGVFSDAFTAITCIDEASAGLDPYTLEAISDVQEAAAAPQPDQPAAKPPAPGASARLVSDDAVQTTAEVRYFRAIKDALDSVDNIVGIRLMSTGKPFDLDSIEKKIEDIKKATEDAKKDAGTDPTAAAAPIEGAKAPKAPATATAETLVETAAKQTQLSNAKARLAVSGTQKVGVTMIKLETLQPKLQTCILKAQVGTTPSGT